MEEFELPKASTVCSLVILSYFLVTAGIAYDIINEPPAVGAVQDEATGVRGSSTLAGAAAVGQHQWKLKQQQQQQHQWKQLWQQSQQCRMRSQVCAQQHICRQDRQQLNQQDRQLLALLDMRKHMQMLCQRCIAACVPAVKQHQWQRLGAAPGAAVAAAASAACSVLCLELIQPRSVPHFSCACVWCLQAR